MKETKEQEQFSEYAGSDIAKLKTKMAWSIEGHLNAGRLDEAAKVTAMLAEIITAENA